VDGRRGYTDGPGSHWYPEQPEYPDEDWHRRDGGWRRDDGGRHTEDVRATDRPYGGPAEQQAVSSRRVGVDGPGQSTRDDLSRPLEAPTNPLAAVSSLGLSPAAGPGATDRGATGSGAAGPGAVGAGLAGPGAGPVSAGPVSPSPMSPGPMSPGAAAPGQAGMGGAGSTPAASAPRQGVYRSGRPALAMLYLIGVVLFEWPAVRLVADGAFGDDPSASTAISGIFLMIGLPLFGRGLFALQAGAGRVPDQRTGHGWLHPPVAYLTVGLALFLAAGAAAG
jgi:hypothetical protein